MANPNGAGPAKLIKQFFGDIPNQQIMALPGPDRIALGSAIARQQGLKPEDLSFDLVEY